MVDEQEDCGFLDVIVGVSRQTGSFEPPFRIADSELYEFIRNGAAMDLTNAVHRACIGRRGDRRCRIAVLLARKRYSITMHSITSYNAQDLGVFFTWGSERFLTRGDIVKEVLDLAGVRTWYLKTANGKLAVI